MSKIKLAESMVDAFVDGNYEFLKKIDEQVDKIVNTSVLELNDYQKFFKQKMASAGKPIVKMSPDEKKNFFASVKAGWAKRKK